MKIIGAELRVAPQGFTPIEAKIIPFEIEIPPVFTETPYRPIIVELTIHTSAGDRTLSMVMPEETNFSAYRSVNEDEFQKGYVELRKRVEAMK